MIAAIGSRMGSPSTDKLVQRRGSACPFTLPQPDRHQCCLIRKNSCWFFFLRPFSASICSAAFSSSGDHLAHSIVAGLLWMVAARKRPDHRSIDHHQLRPGVDPAAAEPGGGSRVLSKAVLLLAIAFNVFFLGFFKYTDFLYGSINDVFGAKLILMHIVLPLGISFITFQKIAFLIDVQAGRVKSFTFREYCTFVLFFPQLIAGPIVHYREMMPQFQTATCRFDKENFAVALTLLFFGLFKKVVLADNMAPLVTPIYEHSAAAGDTPFLMAWMAAIGFTLQLYFDFSGYTDMALGLARFFGIKLPPNFNSPLRASSIIDFWLRWHMTLTRFLTAYLYNPLVLWLTRRRLKRGRSGFSARNPTIGSFVSLLLVPILTTMFISGLWHGAGYGFILWGLFTGYFSRSITAGAHSRCGTGRIG